MTENYDAVTQTQLQMAQAIGRITDAVNNSLTMQVSTVDVLKTLTIPSATSVIEVYGTSAVGDGGAATYIRSDTPTSVQSADGQYWQSVTVGPTTDYFIDSNSAGLPGSGIETQVVTQALAAGTWDVNLIMDFQPTTTIDSAYCKIDMPTAGSFAVNLPAPMSIPATAVIPSCRFTIVAPEVVKGLASASFASGAVTVSGIIQCRGVG